PFEKCVAKTNVNNLFAVVAGNVNDAPSELIAGPNWKAFMQWCSDRYKVVLVDSPPVLALADFDRLTAACDLVLSVVRSHSTQRELLEKCMNQIDRKKLVGAVLNGAQFTKSYQGYYYRYQNDKEPTPKAEAQATAK